MGRALNLLEGHPAEADLALASRPHQGPSWNEISQFTGGPTHARDNSFGAWAAARFGTDSTGRS
eukprot:6404976-Pyramimonas_sp.AAC.1